LLDLISHLCSVALAFWFGLIFWYFAFSYLFDNLLWSFDFPFSLFSMPSELCSCKQDSTLHVLTLAGCAPGSACPTYSGPRSYLPLRPRQQQPHRVMSVSALRIPPKHVRRWHAHRTWPPCVQTHRPYIVWAAPQTNLFMVKNNESYK
jgi:hypothetical protein